MGNMVCGAAWICALLAMNASLLAVAQQVPRVALLFISRAEMPLETLWREFFRSVQNLTPPVLSPQQWDGVMEKDRVEAVTQQLRKAGHFSANGLFQDRACIDNAVILVRDPVHSCDTQHFCTRMSLADATYSGMHRPRIHTSKINISPNAVVWAPVWSFNCLASMLSAHDHSATFRMRVVPSGAACSSC